MKLKKFLLVLLATVSCACLAFAFGCVENKNGENNKCTVNFSSAAHSKYVINGEEVDEYTLKVDKETMVNFSVVVEDGYLPETLVVKADAETLSATDGVYSYRVTKNVTITADVSEDVLEVDDNGVYLVSSLKDLRFMADMVNSGYNDYVIGNYKLENDIDCGGAQLDVIGHFENQYAFFAGVFDGQDHTISNYTISTTGRTYVGLFGCVQLSTASDAAIIQNLNLKDFTIDATATEDVNVCVGGIAAFTAGANIVACSAEGNINVYGSGYFSYAGGAVGAQQSLTIAASESLLYHYHSTVEYVHTKVTLSADNGYIHAAGGVVGYSMPSHERAASMIINSYSEGGVFGAMSSGGVVGMLGDYSSVVNCYSTGFVNATVSFPAQVENREYFAYAGGIAGYVGAETTISDSFTTSRTHADATNVGLATGDIYAYASPATDFVNAVAVYNSLKIERTNATDADYIKDTFNWSSVDWKIVGGDFPRTNYQQPEETSTVTNSFNITLNYGENEVKGDAEKSVTVRIYDNSYFPFSTTLDQYIDEFIVADAEGYTSYGFFFDSDCEQKVPYSFVPTRSITLYVGFADYSKVAGTYEFNEKSGRTVRLTLDTKGTYIYSDGRDFKDNYFYDGTNLKFNNALFARLSGNVVEDEDNNTLPWLNYEPYKFVGALTNGELLVYDGTYFTNKVISGKDNRLAFTKVGAEQTDKNGFVGTWELSATVNEKYTFNGDGTWSYSWKGTKQKEGSYSVNNGVATLTSGSTVIATASIYDSGLLYIKETGKYYGLVNSFCGNWYSSEQNAYLLLDGYGNDLSGSANAIIDGTAYDRLVYVKDGFFDAWVTDTPYTYTLVSGYSLFGYFSYNVEDRTITAQLYDSNSGWVEFNFVLLDYYLGEWITQDEVGGDEPFTIVDFNGLGLYKAEGDDSLGYIVINGTKVPYDSNAGDGFDGKFTYPSENGTEYTLTINVNGTVTVATSGKEANFSRKDEMASTPLVDDEDNVYEFNGFGNLSKGGILTITYSARSEKSGTIDEYTYTIVSGSIDDLNIVINLFKKGSVSDDDKVGTVTIKSINTPTVKSAKFFISLTENGKVTEKNLDLYFPFAGRSWSINFLMNTFYIGKFDLTYEATGNYNKQNVTYVYFPDRNYILVDYNDYVQVAFTMYLLIQDDNNIIVSSYPYVMEGGDPWYYASPSDEVVGGWVNTNTGSTLEFDGTADSRYTQGYAFDLTQGITYQYTRRFGTIYMWRADDESVAYTVKVVRNGNLSGDNVYSDASGSPLKKLVLEEFDILSQPIFEATGNDNTEYKFNFDGSVKVGGENGKCLISSVDGDKTTVEITLDNGTVMTVEVDHKAHTAEVIG